MRYQCEQGHHIHLQRQRPALLQRDSLLSVIFDKIMASQGHIVLAALDLVSNQWICLLLCGSV